MKYINGSEFKMQKIISYFSKLMELIFSKITQNHLMKALTFVFLFFCCAASWAPAPVIKPQVYHWKDIKLKKSAAFGKNVLFQGSTRDLDYLEVSGYRLKPGKAQSDFSDGLEHLVIVKDGVLHVKVGRDEKALDPGSIAMAMPGDPLTLSNYSDKDIYYYIFSYKSKTPIDTDRGVKAGGSFIVDWNDIPFHEQDKGGVRQYFKRLQLCAIISTCMSPH